MSRIDALRGIQRDELGQLSAYAPALRPDIEVHLDANEAPPLLGKDVLARLAQAAGERLSS